MTHRHGASGLTKVLLCGMTTYSLANSAHTVASEQPTQRFCDLVGQSEISLSTVPVGDAVTAGLDATTRCAMRDVVVMYCWVGAFNWDPSTAMLSELRRWVEGTDLTALRLAVVGYPNGRVLQALTADRERLRAAVSRLEVDKQDPPTECFRSAHAELLAARRGLSPDQAVLLLGNFQYINLVNGLVEAASDVRASGIEVFIVALDLDPMRSLASSQRHFFQWSDTGASAGQAAARAFRAVDESTTRHAFETLSITGTVPVEFDYVPDSAAPPAVWNPASRTLAWTFPEPPSAITQTVTYDVRATRCGTFDVGMDSMAWGRDIEGNTYRLDYAPHEVHVPCPTATPTATVPVPTATATTPPTRTPAPSPVPGPLYLPLALHELPCSQQRRAALALVIDTSSSMQERTSGGRTKLAAALGAADTFLDLLSFPADQAVVIGFDSDVQAGTLTSDRTSLQSQLSSLTSETGTEIHLGVDAARTELVSPRRRPDNFPALVLLTDGRASAGPEPGLRAAQAAKSDGIALFTIGLGVDVDRAQLRHMASRPEWFYEAANAEDLEEVYRTVAVDIPCPASRYWGGRP
jgi:hypothetical protein